MASLITDFGARFIVGDPHPQPTTEVFRQAVLLATDVRAALRGARNRLLHVAVPEPDDPLAPTGTHAEAVFYDYTRNRVVRVRGALSGAGPLEIVREKDQPRPSPDEFEEAVALVARSPVWGPLLQAGHVRAYPTMPPNLEPVGDEEVERTIFVGMYSRERKFNRMVGVNMVRRTVTPEAIVPRTSRATAALCGPDVAPCQSPRRGTAGSSQVVWPAPPAQELWRFTVTRPAASSGINGSGVELTNVRYKGRLVLRQAHVPILNVQYDDDLCGPYRDWLYEECCFDAVGTDISGTHGIRWCTQPPQTIWEKNADGGNFNGVAVWEDPDGSLRLLSVCCAGWYRYGHEWRFYPDGRIEPRFRFGAVADSCTCNAHHHHAYYRFDWSIQNTRNVVQELRNGSTWANLTREVARSRTPTSDVRWRVLDTNRRYGYEIITGEEDGYADEWSGPDCYLMLRRAREIDDKRGLTGRSEAVIRNYVRNENVYRKDLVTWYVAHFYHNQPEANALDDHTHAYGPTLQPFNWPG